MSDGRLSRRSILPTIATGAAVAALGAEAQAEGERRYIGTAGPATLSAGNILVVEGALPPLTLTKSEPMQFKVVLQTLDGRVLGQAFPKLAVGSPGFSYRLFCM